MNKKIFIGAAVLSVMMSPISAYAAEESYVQTASAEAVTKTTGSVEAFVLRFYENILGRGASPEEMSGWVNNLKTGKEKGAMVGVGFIQSDEFKKKNLSDEAYVKVLYKAFFNREADAQGLQAWTETLNDGLTRMQVYRGFAESDEFTKLCSEYGIQRGNVIMSAPMDQNEGVTKFISRCYNLCLGRKADESGLNSWCSQILTGKNTAKVAAHGFVFSNEFMKQNYSNSEYVKIMYRLFLNREADSAGLNSWVKVLQSGKSRLHVFEGFADSPEFKKLCQSYGIESGSGIPIINVREAYKEKLQDIYDHPEKYYEMLSDYSPSGNSFRIADVTGDGVEDLIVDFIDTYTAAMHAKVFTYDPGKDQAVESDIIGVGAELYTGGIIEVPASHNHTYGNAVWPTSILRYENGKFKEIAFYHCSEENFNIAEFPYEADKDGDGIVYYFNTKEAYNEDNPIDYAEFKSLYDEMMRGHELINAEAKSLTLRNINSIS